MAQSVARNFLALGGGEALARAVAFAGTLYLARILGAEGYGSVAFVMGVLIYFLKVADFGVELEGSSQIAANPDDAKTLAGTILVPRIGIALVLAGLVAVAGQLFAPEPERTLFALFALTLIPAAASTRWIHVGLERAGPVAWARFAQELVIVALLLYFVRGLEQIAWVPIAHVVGALVGAAISYLSLVKRGLAFGPKFDLKRSKSIFIVCAPIVAQTLLGILTFNADIIFLGLLGTRAQVGYYAAAYPMVAFLANMALAFSMSLLPVFSRLRDEPEPSREHYHRALAQIFAVTLPVAVGGLFVAPRMVDFILGAEYAPSGPVMMVLLWSIPASSAWLVARVVLIAHQKRRALVIASGTAASVNIVLNLILIPEYGITGAAAATVVTEVVNSIFMMSYVKRLGVPLLPFKRLLRPLFAAGVMSAVLLPLPSQLHLLIILPIGVVVYPLALAAVGGVRRHGRFVALAV